MLLTIILLIIAVFLSAFFSGAEVALISTNELKARQYADQKIRHAHTLLRLKEKPHHMLITILIGNNLVNIGGSAIATKLAIDFFASAGVGIATGIMTFVILTFGEIIPKTFCARHAKKIALGIAPIILFLMTLLSPVVWFFYQFSKGMEKITGSDTVEPLVTEEEVKDFVKIGEEEGQIKTAEKEMIQRIFLFDDTEVREIMTPRTDLFALDQKLILSDALPQIVKQEYSRIPVYDKHLDKIKGIVFARDLLETVSRGQTDIKLKDLAKKPLYVPRHQKIDKLLKELQHKKTHMALVVNEHGGVDGIITIEDILEEIVGDIFDESDAVEHLIRPRGKNTWLILGKTPIDVINEEISTKIPDKDQYNTIAGFIQHKLGHVPVEGEEIVMKKPSLRLTVKKVEGPTLLEVLLIKGS